LLSIGPQPVELTLALPKWRVGAGAKALYEESRSKPTSIAARAKLHKPDEDRNRPKPAHKYVICCRARPFASRVRLESLCGSSDSQGLIVLSPTWRPRANSIAYGDPVSRWLYGAMLLPLSITNSGAGHRSRVMLPAPRRATRAEHLPVSKTGSALLVHVSRLHLQDFAMRQPQASRGAEMKWSDSVDPVCKGEGRHVAIGHSRPVERRRTGQRSQSPKAVLKQLPALVVLYRIPVPVLAIAHDGTTLFTNTAFAQMVGFEPDEVLSLRLDQILQGVPTCISPLSLISAQSGSVVELTHKDGLVVRALMTRSAPVCADDRFALVVFQDLTQQLWESEYKPLDEARGSSRR
jgi:PAS domain-containing protein